MNSSCEKFQPHMPGLQVFAIDTVPERLELATALGAIPADGRDKQGVVTAIKEATDGRGADAMMEAVGAQGTVALAFELLRTGGEAVQC